MRLNNKGFTLVEILATIVILGIVMAVVGTFSMNYYETSKKKSEAIFIEKVNKLIDDYIAINSSDFVLTNSGSFTFQKCKLDVEKNDTVCVGGYTAKLVSSGGNTKIPFKVLIDEGLIKQSDFVNPYNKTPCDINNNGNKSYIEVFQDNERVSYFRYKLACISDNNTRDDGYVYNNVPKS